MKTLQVGDQLPYFNTFDEEGNKIESTDMLGSKSVIFFYPKANTPGCTAEACNLRDHYVLLKEKGYRLYGVSADGQQKQKNFKEKFNFPFPLLADEDKAVIDAFGVWGPKKFMGKEFDGIHRMTFIVDETGKVQRVISKVKTKDHAAQILEED